MNIPNNFIIIICLSVLAVSCKSKKTVTSQKKERVVIVNDKNKTPVTTPPDVTSNKPNANKPVTTAPINEGSYEASVANYINAFSGIAKEEMAQYGIPASIKLAQGILESGAGRGTLSQRAKNHFGIKCHTEWTGERVYHDDDEAQECFRKYTDPKYSFRDHSLFLTTRSRYQSLFTLGKDDYKGWANGLKKAGYATDPKYPSKLISIIERYQLNQYDAQVLQKEYTLPAPSSITNSTSSQQQTIKSYIVVKGDTLYNIARRFNMTVETLKTYNGLVDTTISIGQTLYLHPTNE